ncbi:MAG: SH3 domain-containing protein [Rhizobiaceae bacterium]
MICSARVTEAYKACYPNPIRVSRGDRITLTGRRGNWNGHVWLWAKDTEGREGWIPDSLVDDLEKTQQQANEDYNARELDCSLGEHLTVLKSTNGWCWCVPRGGGDDDGDNRAGWVPQQNLSLAERD